MIYSDTGSTVLEMTPSLVGKQIHVVTSSIHHTAKLSDAEISAIIPGDTLRLSIRAIIGTINMEQLQHFRFNKVLLRTSGIHLKFGLTMPDPGEAVLKALTIHQVETIRILLGHTKFNEVTLTKMEELELVALLTDYHLAESLQGFQ